MNDFWRRLMSTVGEALERLRAGEGEPVPAFAARYERVYGSLTRAELHGDDGALVEADLVADLFDVEGRSHHFLDFYSQQGLVLAFERYGFFDLLRDQGMSPILTLDLAQRDEHRLRIYDAEAAPQNLLIELCVGLRTLDLPGGTGCRMLFINWLLMQNPRVPFAPDRPPLPDQQHPGLGLFPHFGYLLRLMAIRLSCDGLMNHPAQFHNGVLYGKFFHFVDPRIEGRFRALERDLSRLPLREATARLARGEVVDAEGQKAKWEAAPQVAPLTPRARAWFESYAYRQEAAKQRGAVSYRLTTPG